MNRTQEKWFDRLREMAEQVVKDQSIDVKKIDPADITKLINDIQVFQVELEIQNDELRTSLDELEKSRTRFSRLFDMAPAGYIILDASGIILDINQTMVDMLHKHRDDLMRKPFSRFIAPDDQGIFLARFTAFYKNPADKTMEIRLLNASSTMFHARLEGRFIPLETYPGKPDIDQFCLIVTDITETKKAENELKSYAHMLNERNKELHCLYSISRLISDPANSMDDIFYETITILANAVQYPDKACGRITYKDREYATQNFTETEWKKASDIGVNDEIIGCVEIYYLEKMPVIHNSPFLPEEEALINSVAMRLGQAIARKQAENKLHEQKKRLEGIIEGTNVGTWEWNVQTGETLFNDKWAQIIGYDLEELEPVTIKTWEKFAHPEDFKNSRELLKLHFAGELPYYDCECRMKHKDGHWVEVHDRGKVITWTSDGRPLMMFGTHQDITQRKQAEQHEKQTRRYLEAILQTTADGFWVLDMRGILIDVNDAYCRMTGYKKDQLIGMSIGDLDNIESLKETASRIERIVATGSEFFETRQRRRDGRVFPVEVSVTWLPINGGRLVCFGRNITERKQAETRILHLEKAESLGRMAGAVAHHYNNLLTVVMGNLDMALIDLPEDCEPAASLTQAMEAARRASKLGSMMLAYLGQTNARRKRLDLSRTCKGFLPAIQEEMPAHITLEADLQKTGLTVRANARQIQQILECLITNAWEAMDTHPDSVFLDVRRVSSSEIATAHRYPMDFQPCKTDYASIEVTDSGTGIPENEVDKIFEPFYSTKFTGRGLGLPVALGAVKTHNGCMTVSTRPGRGTTVMVFLPVTDKTDQVLPDKMKTEET
ncbi:MAG TPA: PAS domain S-box protein [Desulfotignum sp.]|nr:PAS domain S-box protein [Desulfotignum sp.]